MARVRSLRDRMPRPRKRKVKVTPAPLPEAKKQEQFPHIFRSIPAKIHPIHLWRWLILIIILSIFTLQLVQTAQIMYTNYYESELQLARKRTVEQEIQKWQQVIVSEPNYRDAYFQLAVLTYEIGRFAETRKYLEKVFELDPNYQPARKLEENLREK